MLEPWMALTNTVTHNIDLCQLLAVPNLEFDTEIVNSFIGRLSIKPIIFRTHESFFDFVKDGHSWKILLFLNFGTFLLDGWFTNVNTEFFTSYKVCQSTFKVNAVKML